MERLQKFLSRAGVASRRHAEAMIVDGRVKLNGKVVSVLGTQVDPQKDLVLVDGKLVSVNPERKYFLFYKPPGVVTTLSDPEGRPTVGDYAQETGGRVFPVGRLDYDAEGALLLTDDGDLANKLMHPSHQVPRVYLAKVKGVPDEASLQKLVEGVRLEDGMAHAVQAQIFEKAERNTWVKIVVTEGRQHLVKRLCAAIGHPVVRLYRPAHAGLPVHGLRPGELRELTNDEIRRVKAAADGDAQPEPRLTLPARRHGHAAPGFEPEEETQPQGRRAAERREEAPEREEPEVEQQAQPVEPSEETPPVEQKPFVGRPSTRPKHEREDRPRRGFSSAPPALPKGERGSRTFGARDERGGKPAFGDRGPKRSFGDRDERGGKPGFAKRSFGDRPERGGKPAFGDRGPKRSFGDRDERGGKPAFGDRGPKRSFGDRPERGGKPGFGDRGPKRGFGERGAKPGFGDRDERGRKPFAGRELGKRDDRGGFGARPGGKRGFGKPSGEGARGEAQGSASKPFPGERAYGGSGARRAEPREPPFKREGGFKREGRPASRFGGGKPGGGFKKGPPGGGKGGRSSPRKPRGSW